MANRFKGEISLTHEGQSYTMVLDFNALCDFEEVSGRNALTDPEALNVETMSAVELRQLMWAGLRQRHPEMTLQLAGAILSSDTDALKRASAAALPDDEPGAAPGNAKRPRKARA